jgi:glycosyltransferase involved in cell wall biosynthesis
LIPITIKSRNYLERIIFYLLYWNISKKSQLILFISKFTQNQFIECFNYSGRSKVTYLGVGSDWFVNVTEKEKYIISYCNLKFHKNIRSLLEAFNSIHQKFDYKLMLILNMNVRDFDSDIIKLARTNSSIIVEKNIEKIALINKVSRAKCLVVPSLYEGFGLTILEGMACGCPVLASNVTAIPEVGADTIMYFDPYQDGDLLNKLENFLTNDSSELDYIERGRLRAREFTWNRCIDDSYRALTPILKSNS